MEQESTVEASQQEEEREKDSAHEESASVSPPRDPPSTGICQHEAPLQELEKKPEPEEEEGRDFDDRKEDDERNQRQDTRLWEEEEVCAQDSCYCPAGANERDIRRPLHRCLDKPRTRTTQEIEKEVTTVAKPILNIVTKNKQIEHVSYDVPPTSVEEH